MQTCYFHFLCTVYIQIHAMKIHGGVKLRTSRKSGNQWSTSGLECSDMLLYFTVFISNSIGSIYRYETITYHMVQKASFCIIKMFHLQRNKWVDTVYTYIHTNKCRFNWFKYIGNKLRVNTIKLLQYLKTMRY
jgi:hypothetical protein